MSEFQHEVVYHDRATLTLVCRCGEVFRPPWGSTATYGTEVRLYGAHLQTARDAAPAVEEEA